MLLVALAFFGAAALFGLYMAVRHFRRQRFPVWPPIAHGLAAVVGFSLLLFTVISRPELSAARYALLVLIGAVGLGAVNVVFHIRGLRHRRALILAHALMAVAGVSLVAYALVSVATTEDEAQAAKAARSAAKLDGGLAMEPSDAPEAPKDDPAPTAVGLAAPSPLVTFPPVIFERGAVQLSRTGRREVAQIARTFRNTPDIELVQVQGHADRRGTDANNIAVSRARAESVAAALVSLGVDPGALHIAAYGSRCPAQSECQGRSPPRRCGTRQALSRDRRVVLVVLKQGERMRDGALVCERGASLIPDEDRRFHTP